MIINLVFVDSNVPAPFTSAVTSAALILERAITDPITVTIEVGYGHFPGETAPITGGAAEADPNFALAVTSAYSVVSAALTVSAAAIGDTNFGTLPPGATVVGYNNGAAFPSTENYSQVLVWSSEAKALGFIPANQSGVDGYAGFAKDINSNLLVGVALHELTHALGRAPNRLPSDSNIPDIFDLFRFDSANNKRLVYDNGQNAPPAYFSVPSSGTLAHYGQTSDPSDFLNDGLTTNDPFDEFYTSTTSQSLTL